MRQRVNRKQFQDSHPSHDIKRNTSSMDPHFCRPEFTDLPSALSSPNSLFPVSGTRSVATFRDSSRSSDDEILAKSWGLTHRDLANLLFKKGPITLMRRNIPLDRTKKLKDTNRVEPTSGNESGTCFIRKRNCITFSRSHLQGINLSDDHRKWSHAQRTVRLSMWA
jgi:hypothetical protein